MSSELLGTIAVKLGLDADDFRAALAGVKAEAQKAGDDIGYSAGKIGGGWSAVDKSMKGLNETAYTSKGLFADLFTLTMAIGAGLGAAAAGAQVWGSLLSAGFEGTMAQEEATKKLASALRAAGHESKQNVGAFSAMANELEATTTIGDDVVLSMAAMATNMGALPQDIEKTVTAAISLGNALGMGPEEALTQLMKTMDGTAGRLGQLTGDFGGLTEEQLKNGEAIDWVNARYSDQLDLMTQGTGGALKQLTNAWGNLGEAMVDFGVKGLKLDSVFNGLARTLGFVEANLDIVFGTMRSLAAMIPGVAGAVAGIQAMLAAGGVIKDSASKGLLADLYGWATGAYGDAPEGPALFGGVVGGVGGGVGESMGELGDNTKEMAKLMDELAKRTKEREREEKAAAKTHAEQLRKQTDLMRELNDAVRENVLNLNEVALRPTEGDNGAKVVDERSENKAVRDWTTGAQIEETGKAVGQSFASAGEQVGAAAGDMASSMGTAGQMFSEIAQGFAQGGPIGGIIAIIFSILKRLDFFKALVDTMGEDLDVIFSALNQLFGWVAKAVEPLSETTARLGPVFGDLFAAIGGIIEVIVDVVDLFAQIADATITTAVEKLVEGLTAAFEVIGEAVEWIGNAIHDFMAFFGLVDDRTKNANDQALATQAQLNAAFTDLQLQVAASAAETKKSADAARELNEQLTNAPTGFKIAQARFDAISTGASSMLTGNSWDGGFGRGAGDTTWNVSIGTVQTDDPDGLAKALEEKAAWQRFTETGTTSTGGGAAATWRGWR